MSDMRSLSTFALLFFVQITANADVRLPTLFSSRMVLQQETENTIWGFADPGESITVEASWGSTVTTTTNAAGRWQILLATPSHGIDQSLTFRGKNTITLEDIAIGEVWLCVGQSNMGTWQLL